jgi:hypothetical protein
MLQLPDKIDRIGKFNTTRTFVPAERRLARGGRKPASLPDRTLERSHQAFCGPTARGDPRFLVARGFGGGYNRLLGSSVCGCVARVVTVTHGPGARGHTDFQISRTTTGHRVFLKEFFGEISPQNVVPPVRNDSFTRHGRWLQHRSTSGPDTSTACDDGRSNRRCEDTAGHDGRDPGDSGTGRRGPCHHPGPRGRCPQGRTQEGRGPEVRDSLSPRCFPQTHRRGRTETLIVA